MPEENVDLVVGAFESINSRAHEAASDAFSDDVTLKLNGSLAAGIGKGASGKKAVVRWYGDWFNRFRDDYRFDVDEVHDLGDRVFVAATHRATGRASGVPVEQQTYYLYTVRQGLISHHEMWADRDEALIAAGLVSE